MAEATGTINEPAGLKDESQSAQSAQSQPTTPPSENDDLARMQSELEATKEELDKLRKERLSEDERRNLEMKQREEALNAREKDIVARDNKFHATAALADSGIISGGVTVAEVLPFVMGADAGDIDKRIQSFSSIVEKIKKAATDEVYRTHGGKPAQTGGSVPSGEPSKFTYKRDTTAEKEAREIREQFTRHKEL